MLGTNRELVSCILVSETWWRSVLDLVIVEIVLCSVGGRSDGIVLESDLGGALAECFDPEHEERSDLVLGASFQIDYPVVPSVVRSGTFQYSPREP